MALGGGIMLTIFSVGYLARPHDLVPILGLKALPQATLVQAIFDKKVSIEAVRICSIDTETLEFAYILKPLAKVKFKETLAVHFLDAADNIISGTGGIIDNLGLAVEKNGYWLRRIKFPSKILKSNVSQLGLAMFIDVENLYPVQGGNTDWNGTRIKLPLPVNWKSVCESSQTNSLSDGVT